MTLYQEKTGQDSVEVANCHSTLASVYRDNKQFSLAASACENGITCLVKINSNNTDAIIKKYSECLCLLKQLPSEVYQLAVNNYKKKDYQIALCQLEYCNNGKPNQHVNARLGFAIPMASCQRDAGHIEEALAFCDLAIPMLASDTKNLEAVCLKRDKLLTMTSQADTTLKL